MTVIFKTYLKIRYKALKRRTAQRKSPAFSLCNCCISYIKFSKMTLKSLDLNKFITTRSARYLSLLARQKQYGMRSLPDTSTHGKQWESNPRACCLNKDSLMNINLTTSKFEDAFWLDSRRIKQLVFKLTDLQKV